MNFSFDMQMQPLDDSLLKLATKPEETYTFAYTVGDKTTLYKNCIFETSKARCTCGFRRYTKQGYFKKKQIEEMKEHMEIARLNKYTYDHTISISHELRGQKK